MKTLVLIRKYTLGLANALKDDEEFTLIYRELSDFSGLLLSHPELSRILANPFIPLPKKRAIVQEVLTSAAAAAKTTRFMLLLLDHGRLSLLPEIVKNLPVFWNEKKGVSTFEVSSVISLSENQQEKLRQKLEQLEKRPVSLQFKIDPGLIAGLSLKKGNVVYDASLKGHLSKLRERICEG